MTLDIINIFLLAIVLFLAAIVEAFLWKTPVFQYLNKPINTELFGANKKWRGLLSLPIATVFSAYLVYFLGNYIFNYFLAIDDRVNLLLWQNNLLVLSLLIGFVFNLAELPNSYIKRRLNIPAGDESSKVFFFIDHMDSPYGVILLLWLLYRVPLHFVANWLWLTPLLFILATWLRKGLGLK
jgi:hypothetical protein